MAYGLGNVGANLALTRLHPRATTLVMHSGAVVAAVGWIVFALVREPAALLAVTVVTAFGGPMTDLMLLRLIQACPADRIGRIYSLRITLSRSANAIGLAAAVPVYSALGARGAIAAGACVLGSFALARLAVIGGARLRGHGQSDDPRPVD